MSQILKQHLSKFIEISEPEFTEILSYFKTKTVNKKENVLEEGQICNAHYFVLNGLLRKFYINEKGIEQTTEFAIETWWLTDNFAYEKAQPTSFYIQAVEKTEVLYIDYVTREKLLEHFPVMERYFRYIYQRAYAAAELRIKYLFSLSKDELYFELAKNHPEFVQRVPQYLIASFLGFTPEYLSEIRKKNIS